MLIFMKNYCTFQLKYQRNLLHNSTEGNTELLFTNLSLRAGRKSTIITTNFSFDRWSEVFHDPVLTAAMVDRLTHKAYLVNMNGASYRTKETQKWMKNKK